MGFGMGDSPLAVSAFQILTQIAGILTLLRFLLEELGSFIKWFRVWRLSTWPPPDSYDKKSSVDH